MTEPIRMSAADLGTNTLKVTHATVKPNGEILDMIHATETVRLGYGIESTGSIELGRFDACLDFLQREERAGRAYRSTTFIGVATEILRIASNGHDLLNRIAEETSWGIDIISGDREAQLTFLGLKDQIPNDSDCAIVDIGGGSTEAVIVRNGHVTSQRSLPIGSGRLADRFFHLDPPGMAAEMLAIDAAREPSYMPEEENRCVPFVMLAGGSGLFMNSLVEQMWCPPPFGLKELRQLADHLSTAPAQDTAKRIDIPLARAQVLPASVAIAIAVMEQLGASEARGVPSGIRTGLIREFLDSKRSDR